MVLSWSRWGEGILYIIAIFFTHDLPSRIKKADTRGTWATLETRFTTELFALAELIMFPIDELMTIAIETYPLYLNNLRNDITPVWIAAQTHEKIELAVQISDESIAWNHFGIRTNKETRKHRNHKVTHRQWGIIMRAMLIKATPISQPLRTNQNLCYQWYLNHPRKHNNEFVLSVQETLMQLFQIKMTELNKNIETHRN